MVKMGYITQDQADSANEAPIKVNCVHKPYSLNKAPYFVDYVMKELNDIGITEQEVTQGGYKIYTTLNYGYQKSAQSSLENEHAQMGYE